LACSAIQIKGKLLEVLYKLLIMNIGMITSATEKLVYDNSKG